MTAEWWYEPTRDLLLLCLGVWLVSTLGHISNKLEELRHTIEAIQISVNVPTPIGMAGHRCNFHESAITDALDQHGRRERARELSLQLARDIAKTGGDD